MLLRRVLVRPLHYLHPSKLPYPHFTRKKPMRSYYRSPVFSTLATLVFCMQQTHAMAQLVRSEHKGEIEVSQKQLLKLEKRSIVSFDSYILGPGDGLQIELLNLPELSGSYSIGPDGTLYLPRLRAFYVEGFTVEELRDFLTQQFSTYVRDPQVYPPCGLSAHSRFRRRGKTPGYYTLAVRPNSAVSLHQRRSKYSRVAEE